MSTPTQLAGFVGLLLAAAASLASAIAFALAAAFWNPLLWIASGLMVVNCALLGMRIIKESRS